MRSVDYHFVFRALLGAATECGDAGIIKEYDNQCFLALIDAVGHGKIAHNIAHLACDHIERHFSDDLVTLMHGLHGHLKGTRGIVTALCRLDISTGDLKYVGIGNICVKILGPRAVTFVPRDGVVGWVAPTPREQHRRLFPGDILVMYSDGIRNHFDPLDCAELFSGTAKSIANGLLRQFGKNEDDASCIALRYLS